MVAGSNGEKTNLQMSLKKQKKRREIMNGLKKTGIAAKNINTDFGTDGIRRGDIQIPTKKKTCANLHMM